MAQPFTPQIAVPAYFAITPPTGLDHYQDYLTLKGLSPAVAIVVLDLDLWEPVAGPNPYPNLDVAAWRQNILDYQSAGMKVLGYLPTDAGTGTQGLATAPVFDGQGHPIYPGTAGYPGRQWSPGTIEGWIDAWYSVFKDPAGIGPTAHPDGIFFDVGPSPWYFNGTATAGAALDPRIYGFYTGLYAYVHGYDTTLAKQQTVMLNAAYYVEATDWVLGVGPGQTTPAADIATLWEGSWPNYSMTGASPSYPATPPAWWTSHPPERVCHIVSYCACLATSPAGTCAPPMDRDPDPLDLAQSLTLMCQAIDLASSRRAGYVYVFDGGGPDPTDTSYNYLTQYWKQEVAAVVLRGKYPAYVRDWTDSPSSYDEGQEPTTRPDFVSTSDVWNRRSAGTPSGGFFDSQDRPINEEPLGSAGAQVSGNAYARLHRSPCNGQPPTSVAVDVYFLTADFGTGTTFQSVNTTPVTVTLNPSDDGVTTSPVAWTVAPGNSGHVCLAVELYPAGSTPTNSLAGMPAGSATDALVRNSNAKAQRNLYVQSVPPLHIHRIPLYAIAHNGDTTPRQMVLQCEASAETRRALGDVALDVIDSQGRRERRAFDTGSDAVITLKDMQPGENRWIGLIVQPQDIHVGQVLPVSFRELVGGTVVNGFTLALRCQPLDAVIRDYLNRHAVEFRRIDALGIAGARAESRAAMERLRRGSLPAEAYMRFLRSHLPTMRPLIAEVDRALRLHVADPFELESALDDLGQAVASGNADLGAAAHVLVLTKLDAVLSLLHKMHGDPADILQNIRWQRRLYATAASLRTVQGATRLVAESDTFVAAYQARVRGNDAYPRFIESLLSVFEMTADTVGGDVPELRASIMAMQREQHSLRGLQRTHRAYLLELQRLVE